MSLPGDTPTDYVLDEVKDERERQDEKWGQQDHSRLFWLAIIGEEFGECCQAELKRVGHHTQHRDNMREELVQVAACAVAAIESIDREPPSF